MTGAADVPFSAPRLPRRDRLLRRRLPILGLTTLVLAVLGPFGTFQDLRFGGRLAYWGGLILLGSLLFEAAVGLGLLAIRRRPAAWPAMLGGVLLTVSVCLTLAVAMLEHAVRGLDHRTPLGLLQMFGYVSVVTLLVSALPLWLELRDRRLIGPPPPGAPAARAAGDADREPPPIPFLDRVPARLGRELLALEMEDHYVRVHTVLGSDLILMRLRDAVAELAGLEGLQVHRSYWVAAAAVAGAERKPDGRITLLLGNGMRIPVSRSYAAAVRAAGWLERA